MNLSVKSERKIARFNLLSHYDLVNFESSLSELRMQFSITTVKNKILVKLVQACLTSPRDSDCMKEMSLVVLVFAFYTFLELL